MNKEVKKKSVGKKVALFGCLPLIGLFILMSIGGYFIGKSNEEAFEKLTPQQKDSVLTLNRIKDSLKVYGEFKKDSLSLAEEELKEAKERSEEYAKKYTDISALRFSEDFVKERLKSPSTAEFISLTELMDGVPVTKVNDTTFVVNSWVDSQNSFGAMIRSQYSCKMTFIPSTETVQCDDLVIK